MSKEVHETGWLPSFLKWSVRNTSSRGVKNGATTTSPGAEPKGRENGRKKGDILEGKYFMRSRNFKLLREIKLN